MSAVSDLLSDYQHVIEEIRLVTGDDSAFEVVVDGNLVTGQNQNAGPMVAREMMQLLATQELQPQPG